MRKQISQRTCTLEQLEARTLMSGSLAGAGAVSMAYDASGTLHVAYYDSTDTNLKYMTRNGDGTWSEVATPDAAPKAGASLSLAVDSTGHPGITYYDGTNGDLKYARLADGGTWDVQTVDSRGDTGLNPSLAFDKLNQPLISYYSNVHNDLRLGMISRGRWRVRTLASKGIVGRFSSIAVSPTTGAWRVAFESASNRRIMVARLGAGCVTVATLGAAPDWSSRPSLAFDAAGTPSVSYADPAQNNLMVSTQVVGPRRRLTWTPAVVATGASPQSSLMFDAKSGQPLIVYANAGNVMLASGGDSGWSSSPVGSGTYSVAALDGPHSTLSVVSAGAVVDVGTVLSQPLGLSAAITPAGVQLAWADESDVESGFLIERSVDGGAWAALTTTPANTNHYTDSSATAGSAYQYRVSAVNPGGNSEPTNVASAAQAAAAPQAPANVVTTPVSDTEVNLTWDRVGTGEQYITVLRSTDGSAYSVLASLPAGSNIFTDTSCYPNSSYSYRLSTGNAAGNSLPTTALSTSTMGSGATLPAATGFNAAATSPFSINITWGDPSSGFRNWLLERSQDGVSYSIVAVVGGANAAATYTDSPLSPSTTYYYRTRQVSGSGYSDYTSPVEATTAARPAATPLEPTGLTATVDGATQVTLAWNDTNGGASSYVIETAPFSWTDTPAWTQTAITAPGAASYALTTTAETFYYARVRAQNTAGDSGNTAKIVFRTASPGTGSAKTYEIGPGKTYTSLAALDWSKLGPGDTVKIYPNKNGSGNVIPYFEKPLISVRGTEAAPIHILGVADPVTGQKPIIDGTNAVTATQWKSHYMPFEDLSLVLIGTRTSQHQHDGAWSPGYLELSGLEIANGYSGDPGTSRSYTAGDGTVRSYANAWGVYIEKGDHIALANCAVHHNNGGVFAAGQGDQRNLEAITLNSNHIYGNGTVNSFLEHNTYIEGIDTTYEGNDYGPVRPGSAGSGLKDRGAGTIIRYNVIQGGGHLVDLVETQNYSATVLTLASYHHTSIYGNVFYNTGPSGSVTPIHYGGDQYNSPAYRKGVLAFYNNTFINQMDQVQQWRIRLFAVEEGGGVVDARNNVIYVRPDTTSTTPEFGLLGPAGIAYLGRNWISPTVVVARTDLPFTGNAAGIAQKITDPLNDPIFVNFSGNIFRPGTGSALIDAGDQIPMDWIEPTYQFATLDGADRLESRILAGNAADLGAYEYRP
jgi:hypothetical protein